MSKSRDAEMLVLMIFFVFCLCRFMESLKHPPQILL